MSEPCPSSLASASDVSGQCPAIGISAIAVYEPSWVLGNDWFRESLPRKFVHHTGIQSRRISLEDEVTMGVRVVERLRGETDCDLRDCAALVFVSPSVVPVGVARKFRHEPQGFEEHPQHMAQQLAKRAGIQADRVVGMNWFCSGYTRALTLVQRQMLPGLTLGKDQFVLVVTASRISRITDYACPQTAPLFGDMAALTLLARADSQRYPVHFDLLGADAGIRPADSVLIDFHQQENVLVPTQDGGCARDPQRMVFSLNGMGIGDAAPRAMADATAATLRAASVRPEDVQYVVPHQAGTGIVRLATMKLEEAGVRGEVINGLTSDAGNVSSCSIPFALKKAWSDLDGTIACPSAGVGPPGEAKVSMGCVLLRATQVHKASGRAA